MEQEASSLLGLIKTRLPPRFLSPTQVHMQQFGSITKLFPQIPHYITNMGIAFDYAPERPEHIEAILNGLDRYNPETTTIFQDYVTQQCEDRTYDCYANLALLKL